MKINKGSIKYSGKFKMLLKKSTKLFKADPYSNWMLLVIVFIVVNVFVISNKALEFYQIGSDQALLSKEERNLQINTINRDRLNKVLGKLQTRNENYEDLKRNRPFFRDPSI